jgi:NAD-dependent SIR2 family protein deacetylase
VVLTGAGCSTASGIPDYRGPDGSLKGRSPMTYQEFIRSPEARARYWSRSAVGWARIRDARPNPAHRALARLEGSGALVGVITQNVDGLHQAAGSREVLELHGGLARVRCLGCGAVEGREGVQERIRALNPGAAPRTVTLRPDGDAELPGDVADGFHVPGCEACGGILKPDVVFFGENVPRERVGRAWNLYDRSACLLVVGSSLSVFSGRRFVLRARKEGRPVALVNIGATRCDDDARMKVEEPVEVVLPLLTREFSRLTPPRPTARTSPGSA